jgi:uncharacterized protein
MKKPKFTDAMKKDVKETVEVLTAVLEDRGVPRNIRAVVEAAAAKAQEIQEDGVNFSQAIYLLDDISNDVNMPGHTRTDIWEAISRLESLKEKTK